MSWSLMIMAGAVSAAYFTIAAVIVPRIQLTNASPRFTTMFRLGAIAFFVGCGLSHLHIAVDAVRYPRDVHLHELGFHLLQVVGGWLFIFAALRYLDIRVDRKTTPDMVKLAELQDLALRDPLTGAYNRRHFEDVVTRELARLERYGGEASVLLIDIDDFKGINDRSGHDGGDDVLRAIVQILGRTLRPSDTFARLGGDELSILLPSTDRLRAVGVAERIRAAIAGHDFGTGRPVTVCIGVASCPDDGSVPVKLIAAADRAMYWAKRNGKDRTAVSTRDRIGADPQ